MQKSFVTIVSFLMFQSFSHLVSSLDTLKPGDKLHSSSYLISANKIFTLGFFTIHENSNKSYLGIWYTEDLQSRFPVWLANRNTPIYNNSGVVEITKMGKIIISQSGNESIELYSSENRTNIMATLLDSGNFVVREMIMSPEDNKILWQSFDYPTDTLLPGMKLGVDHRTGRNWTLTSWFSETNPAPGVFTLEWDPTRRRLVVRRRGVIYWTSGDLKFYYEEYNLKLYAFEHIDKPNAANLNYNFVNVTNGDEEYFAYSLFQVPHLELEATKLISGWKLVYVGDIIDFDRPVIAEVHACYGNNDGYRGCESWEQPKCREGHQSFQLWPRNFDFPSDYLYDNSSNLSQSDCRESCWKDCECIAFIDEETGCSYWRGEPVKYDYGRTSDYVPKPPVRYVLITYPNVESKRRRRRIWKWIIISMTILVVVLLILGSVFFFVRKYKQGKWKKNVRELQELQELLTLKGFTEASEFENEEGRAHHLSLFTYESILASTDHFSLQNKLGEGGFGSVYKGKTPKGKEIAIKLLSRKSEQGLVEFKTELIVISKLQHRNLVKLLGFCIHGNEKMIIYDYMPNKSLDFFLFDPTKRMELNWETRFNIIEGIAQGLLYLHKFSRLLIIHRDLKASNILLDENMNPKISDFGLAKISKQNEAEALTNKRAGTYGYMAPEYAMQGVFSVKSDIYSFGVLMLEIVSGRKNNSFNNLEGPLSLVEYAWELWKQCGELEIVDPTIRGSGVKDQELRRCIRVGLLCVENRAIDRPHIENVISMLTNETISLPMPKKPGFIARDVAPQAQKSQIQKLSINEISVSIIGGR